MGCGKALYRPVTTARSKSQTPTAIGLTIAPLGSARRGRSTVRHSKAPSPISVSCRMGFSYDTCPNDLSSVTRTIVIVNWSITMPAPSPREQMILAAMSLFQREGYAAASWRRIVQESGAPWGSAHHYFPKGKEQLGLAALEAASQTVAASMARCFPEG